MRFNLIRIFAFGILFCFSLPTWAQNSPAGRPKLPKVFKSNVKSKLKIGSRAFKKRKRKSLKHKRITLKSINARAKKRHKGARGSFKPLKLNDKISVPGRKGARGKKTTVKKMLAELNKYAPAFAKAGYATDGSGPNSFNVSEPDVDPKKMAMQRKALRKKFSKRTRLKTRFAMRLPRIKRAKSRGKVYRLLKQQGYTRKAKKGSRGKTKKSKSFRWNKKKVWGPYGSKKIAAVGMDASFSVFVNRDQVKLTATAGADAWIFKKKKTIFRVSGLLDGDNRKRGGKGEVHAKLTLNILGRDYVKYEKRLPGITYAHEKSFQKDFGYTVRFVIVIIPVSIEVGASFEAGLRWRLSLKPTRIEASVAPFIVSDAFARFAVDIFVAAAGIEGRVTLLDAEVEIHGELGVDGNKDAVYAYANLAADLGISALSGVISAFLKIKWCIVACEKTYRAKIFSWKGFSKTWRLFSVEETLQLVGKKTAKKPKLRKLKGPSVSGKKSPYKCEEGKPSGASNCKVATVKLKKKCYPGSSGCPYWIDTKYKGIFTNATRKNRIRRKQRDQYCRGKKGDKAWCCPEGERSGAKNCKVAHINFKYKQKSHCTKKQPKGGKIKGCAYWIDTRYTGVYRIAKRVLRPSESPWEYKCYNSAKIRFAKPGRSCRNQHGPDVCAKKGMIFDQKTRGGKNSPCGGHRCRVGYKVRCKKPRYPYP